MNETCLICDELMGEFKNDLTLYSRYSDKPIYQLFESCVNLQLPPDVIDKAGICQNCYIKINEIDEHQTIAERIQSELCQMYNNSLSSSVDVKDNIKVENFEIFEVNIQEEEEEIEEPPKKLKSPKRKPRNKEGKDEGYVTIMIDGRKCYQCLICKKIIVRRPQDHLQTHSTERSFPCEFCSFAFKNKIGLYNHRKKMHLARQSFYCDMCGSKSSSRTQLRMHFDAVHFNKRDFICCTCGKAFTSNTSLTAHMNVHKPRERNIICTTCGFRTYAKAKLKRHMMSHTGERNYSCDICGKLFLYSYNVTQHINYVHKGIRYKVDESKLTCSICGHKFPKQWKVREHLKEVHGVEEGTEVSY